VTQRRRLHPILVFLPFAALGIAAAVVFGLRGKHDPAAEQIHVDMARVLQALEAYRAEHGALPEEGSLTFLVPKYLPEEPVDPWGHPYYFASDGKKPFLQSYGQDGLRGGNGPNQDHTNHDGHGALRSR
jgi:general secretion pathway protein G